MKNILNDLILYIIIIFLIITIYMILNTTYSITICYDNMCRTYSQKFGDYILGKN